MSDDSIQDSTTTMSSITDEAPRKQDVDSGVSLRNSDITDAEINAAAERYATGNHSTSFADTSDKRAFIAGFKAALSRAPV